MKNFFTLTAVLALLCVSFSASAQRNCGTMEHLEQQLQQNPDIRQNLERIERFTERYIRNQANGRADDDVITIPVVVHVVYNNAAENITDAQVLSQIAVLNEDFRRLNDDAIDTPTDFIDVAADVKIQFCLASVDPNGAATNGITRTATSRNSFGTNNDMKFDASGGKDAWPTGDYLNIWVCDLGTSLLGYAQFPGGPASTDGVVCNYPAFGRGSQFNLFTNFALGRTTTHEVGHWLNLRHIWGDGGCNVDDFVSDTPEAGGPNYTGTPCTYPGPNSCRPKGRPGQADLPDMFQNYMDYSDDVCMNLFTDGQTVRMRALFDAGGARESLLSSNGCGNGTPQEICDNGIDDDGDGLTDCDDPDCGSDPACQTGSPEVCDNGIDDDLDGLIDCDDPDCSGAPACEPTGSCDAPGGLTTNVTKGGKEADLSWNAVGAAIDYTVTLTNLSSGGSSSTTISGTAVTAINLTKNDAYEWCVIANCSSGPSPQSCDSFTAAPGARETQWVGDALRIYPNPARNKVTVEINEADELRSGAVLSLQTTTSAADGDHLLWIMDAYGRVVQTLETAAGETRIEIPVANLAQGLYLIKVTDSDGNLESAGRMIINR